VYKINYFRDTRFH